MDLVNTIVKHGIRRWGLRTADRIPGTSTGRPSHGFKRSGAERSCAANNSLLGFDYPLMNKRTVLVDHTGFTLIELLVVMSIITILASMMLPSLGRAKEKARMTTCLNNLHQIGISLKLYTDDHDGKLPPTRVYEPATKTWKRARQTLGGPDPAPAWLEYYPTAQIRPLYHYLKPSEVYHCPLDKGQQLCATTPAPPPKPSNWFTLGCSYQYNAGALVYLNNGGFLKTPADAQNGIAEKSESWAPSPERYILLHEPPARLYASLDCPPHWHQWHYSRGATDMADPVTARQQFFSPILFVDGHVAAHNFSKSLYQDPYHPYEPTKDWIWYKAADE